MTMVIADFRAEADAEATRLTRARALTRAGDDEAAAWLDGAAAWMTTARSCHVRRAVGPGVVMLWRVAFENIDGAIVESQLVAVALASAACGRHRAGRHTLKHIIAGIAPAIETRITAFTADWQRRAQEAARAFAAAQTARRRAIAAQLAQAPARQFQPGLFDRRAERAHAHLAEQNADAATAVTEHLTGALSSEAITLRRPQLLLVLAP
jgi:hypothetical protein